MSIELKLSRASRIYHPSEPLEGKIIVKSSSSISHYGVRLTVNGSVNLQRSDGTVKLCICSSLPSFPSRTETLAPTSIACACMSLRCGCIDLRHSLLHHPRVARARRRDHLGDSRGVHRIELRNRDRIGVAGVRLED
nr:down syndrome critical region protein 3 like [Quercus suber]